MFRAYLERFGYDLATWGSFLVFLARVGWGGDIDTARIPSALALAAANFITFSFIDLAIRESELAHERFPALVKIGAVVVLLIDTAVLWSTLG